MVFGPGCRCGSAAIAKKTNLSNGTVRDYIATVINKLGVTSRAEAARTARRNGWIRARKVDHRQ
jgi:DNA-binding NarL/FixJ family response regulator